MKLKVNRVIAAFFIVLCAFVLSGCNWLNTWWDDVDITKFGFEYNSSGELTNYPIYTDSTSGVVFIEYSLFDSTIDEYSVNNVSVKNIGYNICGFEGYLKYSSGPVYDYGFLFGVDLDSNSYYMVSLSQNGTFTVSYFNGNTLPKGTIDQLFQLYSGDNEYLDKTTGANKIKVETSKNGAMSIYLNGNKLYTIDEPVNPRGTVGMFQMLSYEDIGDFNSKNPMVSLFEFSKVQRY